MPGKKNPQLVTDRASIAITVAAKSVLKNLTSSFPQFEQFL